MFENLLYQDVSNSLAADIRNGRLPGALLFSGPVSSGKLTAALETARVLSCTGQHNGAWTCSCPSCVKHKSLVSPQLLLAGPRDCSLEITAAKNVFLKAQAENARYSTAARYLFLRSIRKLTLRFHEILWQSDDRLAKIASVMGTIEELLEQLDFSHELPDHGKLEKICSTLETACKKLEDTFLYDSLPVQQIRNMSLWAHMTSREGKKVIIIENADRMLESTRNALLKILEEPPEDTVFILTTPRRGAVMPTILSRVRTYSFRERLPEQQSDVIRRIFHDETEYRTIDAYLRSFLPVKPAVISENAGIFFTAVMEGHIPDIQNIVKNCGTFAPRILFRIFLEELLSLQRPFLFSAEGTDASAELVQAVRSCLTNVTTYNQTPASSLEELFRDLAYIRKMHGGLHDARIC
jgi:DNA polymerase-3 subunit gamma/tau